METKRDHSVVFEVIVNLGCVLFSHSYTVVVTLDFIDLTLLNVSYMPD